MTDAISNRPSGRYNLRRGTATGSQHEYLDDDSAIGKHLLFSPARRTLADELLTDEFGNFDPARSSRTQPSALPAMTVPVPTPPPTICVEPTPPPPQAMSRRQEKQREHQERQQAKKEQTALLKDLVGCSDNKIQAIRDLMHGPDRHRSSKAHRDNPISMHTRRK